jgi:hypothetical protein
MFWSDCVGEGCQAGAADERGGRAGHVDAAPHHCSAGARSLASVSSKKSVWHLLVDSTF